MPVIIMGAEGRVRPDIKSEHLVSHENSDEAEWTILHCKRGKEQLVSEQLHSKGFETFIPRYWSGEKPTNKSFLPGYLFVKLDENAILMMPWIRTRNGVRRQVMDGEEYAKVPQAIIDAVRDQLNKKDTADLVCFPPFKSNQAEISRDSLKGLAGVFDMTPSVKERMLVMLDAGKQYKADIQGLKERRVV